MKILVIIALITIVLIGATLENGIFTISPQPIEFRQILFILITILSFIVLIILHMIKAGNKVLFLFFVTYPFLSQSVHYLNVSSAFFVLTPSFLFLLIHFVFSRGRILSKTLILLFLFCSSILISVIAAENPNTASAFFILGVGSFALIAYMVFLQLIYSRNPIQVLRGYVLSVLAGSIFYLAIEFVVFRIRPEHIPYILMRRWDLLPMGRFITGGYREPAGLGFVYSLLFFIIVYFIQSKTISFSIREKIVNVSSFLFICVMILIVGTRSAIFNLINIFLVIFILSRVTGSRRFTTIKPRYLVALVGLSVLGFYFLLPRTILNSRSSTPPSWIEPTYVQIFGNKYQVVGSTSDYLKHTQNSLIDIANNPLGSGPLNATPITENEQGGFASGYYYSILSNLIVIGATFGWLSLGIWIFFLSYISFDLYNLRRRVKNQDYFLLSLILLATIIASILPGSPFFGPGLNWGNFNRLDPINPSIKGLPAEYISLLSGLIIGSLSGFLHLIRFDVQRGKRNISIQMSKVELNGVSKI